ncbi:hypothetical protein [Sphingomonas sp. NFX23]|uniref:hypothetical protein n=1 Tax=Sphingomonas sp. NFX23 TaxID=2819532 RepID=UPI003CE8132F
MSEPQLFSPADGVDYLAIGRGKIVWFKDAEAYSDDPDEIVPPEWAVLACGWPRSSPAKTSDIGADDLSAIAQGIIAQPLSGYPVARVDTLPIPAATANFTNNVVTFDLVTPVRDLDLPGLFRVNYVSGATGLAYSDGIQGYQIFVTVPRGYVIIVVASDDDNVRVGAVLRPADKPGWPIDDGVSRPCDRGAWHREA